MKNGTDSPGIAFFNSSFITDNVHVGDYTDLPQKRNLYRGIIGAQGVAHAADKVDELNPRTELHHYRQESCRTQGARRSPYHP